MADFPLYRKYAHERTYYKILNDLSFEELIILGKNYNLKLFTAKTFIDRHLVNDLIENKDRQLIETDQSEFEERLRYCRENFNRKESL